MTIKPYYEEPGITIYCGDCMEILPQLEPVDLVLTDPPYGIKRDKGFCGSVGLRGLGSLANRRRFEDDDWDAARPEKAVFDSLLSLAPLAIIFGGNFFADILPQSKHWIVWDKLNTMPSFADCELIWTNSPRTSIKKKTFEYNGLVGKEKWRAHPTQKPLALLCSLVKDYSKMGDTILDPFMGSGTTLRAAKDLGRKAIGIEIEEKYCAIAVERLRQEVLNFS
jgi:DNA modification methylase